MNGQQKSKSLSELKRKSRSVAGLLKQLSHPDRLSILCCMVTGEKTVGEIEKISGASQSAVSQYLKNMRLQGLVNSRREGKLVYNKISDRRVSELINSLYLIFCQ